MSASVERFSNRVQNYVKYRPGYPPEMLQFFKDRLGLTQDFVIADIGSGTGFSAKPFLDNGNIVYGVEPNAAMREAAELLLQKHDRFRSVNGTSNRTGLPDNFVDLVIAAQAFHWFDPETTQNEFKRILKPGGYVCLIWNERQLDSTPFLREYEQLLLKYANDYEKVRHENINDAVLENFFQQRFERATFNIHQILDLDGLKGRVMSSSYMPNETDPKYGPMVEELSTLFAKHAEGGKITILYDTRLFYSQF
ncbi:MAG: class I SAM-dependent methyltransferase [Pyrinomonadaceae bacterium]